MTTIRGSFRALHRVLTRRRRRPSTPTPIARAISAEEQARLDLYAELGIDPRQLPLGSEEGEGEVAERWEAPEPQPSDDAAPEAPGAGALPTNDGTRGNDGVDRPSLDALETFRRQTAEEMNSQDRLSVLQRFQTPPTTAFPLSHGEEGLEETVEALDKAVDLSPPKGLETGPTQERDARAVLLLVQMRFLSLKQLSALAYPNTHPTVARARMRVLARQGWVKLWTDWTVPGGHPKYAFPTKRALAFAYPQLLAITRGTPAATIVRHMIPQTPRKALVIEGRIPPMHFHHQVEVNEVAAALAHTYGEKLLWVSAWDCPFPDDSTQKYPTLPQPDLVAIIERNGTPELLFVEHDRVVGSLKRFVERKCLLYAMGAEQATKFFGFPRFMVLVTVRAGTARDPLRRLRHLLRVTLAAGGDSIPMRFALHAWATASLDGPICFTGRNLPITSSNSREAHPTLEPLFP
jgi:hypothetical protein